MTLTLLSVWVRPLLSWSGSSSGHVGDSCGYWGKIFLFNLDFWISDVSSLQVRLWHLFVWYFEGWGEKVLWFDIVTYLHIEEKPDLSRLPYTECSAWSDLCRDKVEKHPPFMLVSITYFINKINTGFLLNISLSTYTFDNKFWAF